MTLENIIKEDGFLYHVSKEDKEYQLDSKKVVLWDYPRCSGLQNGLLSWLKYCFSFVCLSAPVSKYELIAAQKGIIEFFQQNAQSLVLVGDSLGGGVLGEAIGATKNSKPTNIHLHKTFATFQMAAESVVNKFIQPFNHIIIKNIVRCLLLKNDLNISPLKIKEVFPILNENIQNLSIYNSEKSMLFGRELSHLNDDEYEGDGLLS